MSYASTKSLADTLALGLADPREPTVCPDCFRGFALRSHPPMADELKELIPRLRIDCHALFDACVATLTFPRSSEELERLALRLAANRRLCSTHRMPWRPFKSEAYLDLLMSSAADVFNMPVRLGDGAFSDRAEKGNKSFADKKGRWPARLEQLFPDGVQAAVESLLGYCELYISDGPLCMLGEMLNVARPAVMPVLALDPFRARLVDIVLGNLQPVASRIDEHKLSSGITCDVLEVLRSGAGARPDDCARFFAGHESALLGRLGHLADRIEEDDPNFNTIAYCCIELADHCDDPVPARVDRWFDAPGRCRCRNMVTAQTVHTLVLMCKAMRVCAGPACSLSIFQKEDGRPFQACARCKVPRYCSRACQLADWRGAPPHKDLCAVFCKLNAHTCTGDNLPQFEAAFQCAEREFSEGDRQALESFVSSDCEHAHPSADV